MRKIINASTHRHTVESFVSKFVFELQLVPAGFSGIVSEQGPVALCETRRIPENNQVTVFLPLRIEVNIVAISFCYLSSLSAKGGQASVPSPALHGLSVLSGFSANESKVRPEPVAARACRLRCTAWTYCLNSRSPLGFVKPGAAGRNKFWESAARVCCTVAWFTGRRGHVFVFNWLPSSLFILEAGNCKWCETEKSRSLAAACAALGAKPNMASDGGGRCVGGSMSGLNCGRRGAKLGGSSRSFASVMRRDGDDVTPCLGRCEWVAVSRLVADSGERCSASEEGGGRTLGASRPAAAPS